MSVLVVFTLVVFTGCTNQNENKVSIQGDQKIDVKIAIFHHILSTSFVAAMIPDVQGQTCFDKAGINPLINKRSRGPEVVDSLVSGSVEFGTLAITPQVFQILQGDNLTVFATYQTSDRDIKFVGRKSFGLISPAHIKGKRIGYVGGTYGEIFLDRYFKKHSISRDSVILTSGAPAYLRDLFLNGELDGAILWEPVVQDIILDGSIPNSDLYIDIDRSIYTARVNLLALPKTLKEKEAKAKRVIDALICGEYYLKNEPKLVQDQLEKWLGRQTGSLDGAFYPETFRITFDSKALIADLGDEANWANTTIFSGKAFIPNDFSDYISNKIMKQAAPSRIID